jgi:glycerophosphoryl diester phosphodiesterase
MHFSLRFIAAAALSFALQANPDSFANPLAKTNVVIAHRGASGYLPEHTMPGMAMAHGWGVDYIELDLVVTKDSELVVLHDVTLDDTTDVEDKFPGRSRKDGKWYAVDFALAELRTLNVHERTGSDGETLKFPGRFPYRKSRFQVPTFDESVELIQGMNNSTGRKIGIYPELKDTVFHTAEKKDIVKLVVEALQRHNFVTPDSGVVLQCFEADALKRLRNEFKVKLPLVQLIGSDWGTGKDDWAGMKSEAGLAEVAKYADGIGPWLSDLFDDKTMKPTAFMAAVKKSKIPVHAYTLRADQLPKGVSFEAVAKKIYGAGIQGIFTDQGDRLVKVAKKK